MVETQPYQHFKLWLAEHVPVDRDILHVVIGALILLATIAVIRDRSAAIKTGLYASLVAALAMEALDVRDTLVGGGVIPWRNAFFDVVRTIFVPTAAVILTARRATDTSR